MSSRSVRSSEIPRCFSSGAAENTPLYVLAACLYGASRFAQSAYGLPSVPLLRPPARIYLSKTRDLAAARTFFRRALKRHGEPESITLDGFEPSHCALRRMGIRGEFNFFGPKPMKIRSSRYLNNTVEQDHRRVNSECQPCWASSLSRMLESCSSALN